MQKTEHVDYYEALQLSRQADPETVHRVYRLLARRFHPDNQVTGDPERFRIVFEAHQVLSDPQRRAEYDAVQELRRYSRSRVADGSNGGHTADGRDALDFDVDAERAIRLNVLNFLYARRRAEPWNPGVYPGELASFTGQSKQQIEFALWFLTQKKLAQRSDDSRMTITADGVDYLEQNRTELRQALRLTECASR